jgi:hypothetical protein
LFVATPHGIVKIDLIIENVFHGIPPCDRHDGPAESDSGRGACKTGGENLNLGVCT